MQLRRVVNLSRTTRSLLTNRSRIYFTAINNFAEQNFISLQVNGKKGSRNVTLFDARIEKRCAFCSSSSSSAHNFQTEDATDPLANLFPEKEEEDSASPYRNINTHEMEIPAEFSTIIREERDNLSLKIRDLRRKTITTEGYIQLPISFIQSHAILLSLTKLTESIKRNLRTRLKAFKENRNLAIRIPIPYGSQNAENFNFFVKQKSLNTIRIEANDRNIPFPAQIGQPLEIRRISDGENLLAAISDMFNQPPSWWTARPGYQTLLYALKIQPIPTVTQPTTPTNLLTPDRLNFYDAEQKRAIEAALDEKKPLVTIYGPKGTGKTRIAAEVTKKLTEDGKRVLVSTQFSNIVEFLDRCGHGSGNDIVGRVITLSNDVHAPCSMGKTRKSHPKWSQLKELYEKRDAAVAQLQSTSYSNEKQRSEIESLNQQIDSLRLQVDDDIFQQAQILINFTPLIVRPKYQNRFYPDVQIIDDMKIFHKSHCYAVISQAPRTIILGDTIGYTKDALNSENKGIVSQMVDNFHTNEGICFPLTTQYSSNATIFEWPNNVFYFGRMRTGESVANQLIVDRLTTTVDKTFGVPERHDVIDLFQSDSPNVESETTKEENVSSSSKFEPLVEAFFSAPLLFFNTDMVPPEDAQFFRFNNLIPQNVRTKYNLGEALLMAAYADLLLRKGQLQMDQIGFLTRPEIRNCQQNVLRHLLQKRIPGFDSAVERETERLGLKQQFAIGNEHTLGHCTRDVILRGRTGWNIDEEKAMALRWLALALSNARRQFVLIDSKAHLQQLALPELDDFLQIISDKGLIVSPYEIISPEALREARHLLLDEGDLGKLAGNQMGGEISQRSPEANQQRVQTQQRRGISGSMASQDGYRQRGARQNQFIQSSLSRQARFDGYNRQPTRQRSLSNNYGQNYQFSSQQQQQEPRNWPRRPRSMETGFQRSVGGQQLRNNYNYQYNQQEQRGRQFEGNNTQYGQFSPQRQQQFVQSLPPPPYQNYQNQSSNYHSLNPDDYAHNVNNIGPFPPPPPPQHYPQNHSFQQQSYGDNFQHSRQTNFQPQQFQPRQQFDRLNAQAQGGQFPPQQQPQQPQQFDYNYNNQYGRQLYQDSQAPYYPSGNPYQQPQQNWPPNREQQHQQQIRNGFYTGNSHSQTQSSPGFRQSQSSAQPTRRPPQFQSNNQREFSSDGYQQQAPYSPWKYVEGGRAMSRNSAQFEDDDWAMPPRNQVHSNARTNRQPFNRRSNYKTTSPNQREDRRDTAPSDFDFDFDSDPEYDE